jgi:tyrosyl-tRNA synthetase
MAKAVLAFEATKITHGVDAAQAAWRASMEAFHSRPVDNGLFPTSTIPRQAPVSDTSAIPHYQVTSRDMEDGILISSACAKAGLTKSMSEAKRLIEQGGIYINDRQIKSVDEKFVLADFSGSNELRVRKGKKKYLIIEILDKSV